VASKKPKGVEDLAIGPQQIGMAILSLP